MNIGKLIRLNRLFAHPSGRLCSIAVDHFIGYGDGLPPSLAAMKPTLAAIVAANPDAVTMHKGIAASLWQPYAGKLPLIIQSSLAKVDGTAFEQLATAEDAVRLGADAIAVAIFIRGNTEAASLRMVGDVVRDAARFELPVICHVYPRRFEGGPHVSYTPEDIAWAVHCVTEVGVDVVKAPYCGDVAAHAEIVANCPTPIVAAGGPKTNTLAEALGMVSEVVQSGALGATIGRNVWGFPNITANVQAFCSVIHDGVTPQQAMANAGLAPA